MNDFTNLDAQSSESAFAKLSPDELAQWNELAAQREFERQLTERNDPD